MVRDGEEGRRNAVLTQAFHHYGFITNVRMHHLLYAKEVAKISRSSSHFVWFSF